VIFLCERCCRCLGPTPDIYRRVYKSRPLCLTCRRDDGEKYPTESREEMILNFEKHAIRVVTPAAQQVSLSA
jgi:recombinational DNA repair protein (RecF pathway)